MIPSQSRLLHMLIFLTGLFFLLSGLLEITRSPLTWLKTIQMGYPPYFIVMLGIMKVAGVIALWQVKMKWLREWAFAGFTFDTVFAFVSGWYINSYADCIKSAIAFAIIVSLYFALRRRNDFA